MKRTLSLPMMSVAALLGFLILVPPAAYPMGSRRNDKAAEEKVKQQFPRGAVTFGKTMPTTPQVFKTRHPGPDIATQTSKQFGPEIRKNIEKMKFKNEDEYKQALLKHLGVKDEKNVVILQKTYNGVPGVSVIGGRAIEEHNRQQAVEQRPKPAAPEKTRIELDETLKTLEGRNRLEGDDIKELVKKVNIVGGMLSADQRERLKKVVAKKAH